MIKVAITEADSPQAGELIRILINHPDVEIASLVAPRREGIPAYTVHHGLIGESKLVFSSSLNPDSVDVLFLTNSNISTAELLKIRLDYPELNMISFHHVEDFDEKAVAVFALPEINRKQLVRGAKTALIPSPIASAVLVSLFPLAQNLLLNGDIEIKISAPEDIIAPDAIDEAMAEIQETLTDVQKSFSGKISITTSKLESTNRGLDVELHLSCPIDMEHILDFYHRYDDHNFSFAVTTPVEVADAVGTEKCIISLAKDKEDILHIHTVADCRLRGAAGEAVHVLNLMCGLHEKTGLALKSSIY